MSPILNLLGNFGVPSGMNDVRFCCKCDTMKPVTEFHRHYGKPRSICKVCANAYQRNRAPQAREANRRFLARNPGKAVEYTRRWQKKNASRHTEYNRQWWAKNRDRRNEYDHQKRRKRYMAIGNDRMTPAQFEARIAMFGWRCWICRAPYDEVDHVKPLIKGGRHIPANIRPICRSCNAHKHAKWPFSPGTAA